MQERRVQWQSARPTQPQHPPRQGLPPPSPQTALCEAQKPAPRPAAQSAAHTLCRLPGCPPVRQPAGAPASPALPGTQPGAAPPGGSRPAPTAPMPSGQAAPPSAQRAHTPEAENGREKHWEWKPSAASTRQRLKRHAGPNKATGGSRRRQQARRRAPVAGCSPPARCIRDRRAVSGEPWGRGDSPLHPPRPRLPLSRPVG